MDFFENVGAFPVGFFLRPRTTYLFSRGRTCVHRLPYRAMKDCDLLHGVASLSVGEDGGWLQILVVLAQNLCLSLTALPAVGIRPVILQGASLQAPNGAVVQKKLFFVSFTLCFLRFLLHAKGLADNLRCSSSKICLFCLRNDCYLRLMCVAKSPINRCFC